MGANTNTDDGQGITWGLCHFTTAGTRETHHSILARFDCDLRQGEHHAWTRDSEHYWPPEVYFRSGLSADAREESQGRRIGVYRLDIGQRNGLLLATLLNAGHHTHFWSAGVAIHSDEGHDLPLSVAWSAKDISVAWTGSLFRPTTWKSSQSFCFPFVIWFLLLLGNQSMFQMG